MGHVAQRPGKWFMVSRQTMYHMAFSHRPVLVFDRDENEDRLRYPCGGFVFVPDENGTEGM